LPAVVWQRKTETIMFCVLLIVLVLIVFAFVLVAAALVPTVLRNVTFDIVSMAICLASLVFFGRYLVVSVIRGPILAADETGLWLHRTEFSRFALHIPWAYVRRVYPKWMLGELVYVEVDPVVKWPLEGIFGLYARAAARMGGKGVAISLTFTDANQLRLLGELDRLAGRRLNA
jgi:hypothetical protein